MTLDNNSRDSRGMRQQNQEGKILGDEHKVYEEILRSNWGTLREEGGRGYLRLHFITECWDKDRCRVVLCKR